MMLLLFNVLMAFCFALMTGFTFLNFALGMVLSFIILVLLPQLPTPKSFPLPELQDGRKLLIFGRNLFLFLVDFFWDLTVSNVQIAWDVWTPKDYYTPILINVPVGDLTPLQLTLLASRITLTPGTLSAELTKDRQTLIVHVMYPGEGDVAQRLRNPIDILRKGLVH